MYAGLRPRTSTLALRDKQELALSAGDLQLFEGEWAHGMATGGTDRYAYAIYRVTLDAANAVRAFEPSVVIDGRVLLEAFLAGRHFEGHIAARADAMLFENAGARVQSSAQHARRIR